MKMQTTRSTLGNLTSRRPPLPWPNLQAAPVIWESGALAHRKGPTSLSLILRPRRLPLGKAHLQPVW